MRWTGMPMAMWAVFAKSFEKQLTAGLGLCPGHRAEDHGKGQAEVPGDHRKAAQI